MSEKIFADGMMVKEPREGAPEFIMGSLSIKVEEFKAFLDKHVSNSGWVNIDLLKGRSGKPYAALNTYKPERPDVVKEDVQEAMDSWPNDTDGVPF